MTGTELNQVIALLEQADGAEGWRARTKQNVELLERVIGIPLAERMGAAGLAPSYEHKHDAKPQPNAQFVFQERFGLPPALLPNVRNFVELHKSDGSARPAAQAFAYLGLTVSHRWTYGEKHQQQAHIRFGFAFEAKKERCEQARPVLQGKVLGEQLAGAPEAAGLEVSETMPLPGLSKAGVSPRLWSIQLGRMMSLAALRDLGSVEALLDRAQRDLVALHRALSS